VNDPEPSFKGFAPSGSTLCPACEYDLRGLPSEHKCPECGLTYDRETMVWTARIPIKHHLIMVFGFSAFFLLHFLTRGLAWSGTLGILTGVYLLGAIAHLLILVRKYRQAGRLAVTPMGIICNATNRLNTLRIAWAEIYAIDVKAKRHGLALNKFSIMFSMGQSIDITPFANTREERYQLLAIVEDHRRKRLGLEPRTT